MNPIQEANKAFQEADARWSALLKQKFGKQAGDKRYQPEGKGEIGSELRAAHDAFMATGEAWRKLVSENREHNRREAQSDISNDDAELMADYNHLLERRITTNRPSSRIDWRAME